MVESSFAFGVMGFLGGWLVGLSEIFPDNYSGEQIFLSSIN